MALAEKYKHAEQAHQNHGHQVDLVVENELFVLLDQYFLLFDLQWIFFHLNIQFVLLDDIDGL